MIKNQKNQKKTDPAGEIKFTDERLNKLRDEIIKQTEEYENKDLEHAVSKNNKYNIVYKELRKFATKIMHGKLSLKEAKKNKAKCRI